jgi:hypothetical protein
MNESHASESPILSLGTFPYSGTWDKGKHDGCHNSYRSLSALKRGGENRGV